MEMEIGKFKKVRIENGSYTITVRNANVALDRRLRTIRVYPAIEVVPPDRCVVFGKVLNLSSITFR